MGTIDVVVLFSLRTHSVIEEHHLFIFLFCFSNFLHLSSLSMLSLSSPLQFARERTLAQQLSAPPPAQPAAVAALFEKEAGERKEKKAAEEALASRIARDVKERVREWRKKEREGEGKEGETEGEKKEEDTIPPLHLHLEHVSCLFSFPFSLLLLFLLFFMSLSCFSLACPAGSDLSLCPLPPSH